MYTTKQRRISHRLHHWHWPSTRRIMVIINTLCIYVINCVNLLLHATELCPLRRLSRTRLELYTVNQFAYVDKLRFFSQVLSCPQIWAR